MNVPRQLTLDLIRPPQASFDNFVVGRNAESLATLKALAAGTAAGIVYLWGEPGSGRSHLLAALVGASGAAAGGVAEWSRNAAGYAVDDVEVLPPSEQQRLFVLIDQVRSQPGQWLVAAGAAPPSQTGLRADLATRLAWGLVYQVHALSDQEKAQALAAHARSRGSSLPPEVVNYLLSHMPRDMRTLMAILDAVDRHALALQRPITLPLLRDWAQTSIGAT